MLGERIYRWMLHAYPAAFRHEYGDRMIEAYRDLRDRTPWWSLWPRLAADVAGSASSLHVDALWADVRYAMRQMRSAPGLAAIVVLTLGIGVGVNTAIYSFVDALLFRTMPARDPEQLVAVARGAGDGEPASYPDYVDYRDRGSAFEGLAACFLTSVRIAEPDVSEQVMAEVVSGNYFGVLGLRAAAGRLIALEGDGRPGENAEAVISYGLWKRRHGLAADALGRTLRINGMPFTIIGVAPEQFSGSSQPVSADVWIPVSMQRAVLAGLGDARVNRGARWLGMVGRLKEGVSAGQAEAELNAIDALIQAEHPEFAARDPEERARRLLTVSQPRGVSVPHLRRRITAVAGFLMTLTGLVLAVACMNVANLLLARASSREREMSVRLALGAARRRVVRQLLTESVLLALAGGTAGVLMAWLAMTYLGELRTPFPGPFRFSVYPRLDLRVLGFGIALGSLTGVVFGLVPALRASRANVVSSLKLVWSGAMGEARKGNRMRNALVAGQAAVATVMLVCCGLLARSAMNLEGAGPGFDASRHVVAVFDLISLGETAGGGGREQLLSEVKRRMLALPGVTAAAWVSNVPATMNFQAIEAALPDSLEGGRPAMGGRVDADFFATTGIAILRGRAFVAGEERLKVEPAIVNERMAALLWPRGNALGSRLWVRAGAAAGECVVVGIARNAKYFSPGEETQPYVYRPYRAGDLAPKLLIRTAGSRAGGSPRSMLEAVRAEAAGVHPALEVRILETYSDMLAMVGWPARLAGSLLGVLSVLAVGLTAAGLYAVTSYGVERRRQEIGVRIALGADRRAVVGLVLRRAGAVVMAGAAVGWLLAAGFARLLRGLLAGVSPVDPATYFAAGILLMSVAMLAAAVPALRAARVDPVETLR